MKQARTLTDDGGGGADARVHLLVYVLSYDDLRGGGAWSSLLPEKGALVFARADGESAGARATHVDDHVEVADGWASSLHARLVTDGEIAMLHDEGSRNGTWVNGVRTTSGALRDGDAIEIGHCLFVYRRVDARAAELLASEPSARMLGRSPTLSAEGASMLDGIGRVARSRDPILVLGETGAGKESTAETIHRLSKRTGPLVAVDGGAVPDNLFESTFFGHKKGAFTGAETNRVGVIAQAHQGTLFLDEVGNLSQAAQAKLLRVIETGLVTPLGANEAQKVDVRWVAATNRDLYEDAVAPGGSSFRADLLRRLAGFVARLPPLRARREDLGTLASSLLEEADIAKASITTNAARRLFLGPLPGNIRQLRAALRSAALLAGSSPIDVAHLPHDLPALVPEPEGATPTRSTKPPPPARPSAEEVARAIETAKGNIVHAADLLGTHPRQVYRWIERYAIDLEKYR